MPYTGMPAVKMEKRSRRNVTQKRMKTMITVLRTKVLITRSSGQNLITLTWMLLTDRQELLTATTLLNKASVCI